MNCRLVCCLMLAVVCFGESQKEKDLAAQHARDLATIDRLIREADTARAATAAGVVTGAAISKLKKESTANTANVHDAVAQVAQARDAAVVTKTAVERIETRAEKIQSKTDLITPITVPIWLAVITAISSLIMAFINKGKLVQIHAATNSNLDKVNGKLDSANAEIASLRQVIGTLSPHDKAKSENEER